MQQETEGTGSATHSAKLTRGNDDAPLMQHAGVQVQHVIHVHCHKVLRQIPLTRDKTNIKALL